MPESLLVAGRRGGATVIEALRSIAPVALRPLRSPPGAVRVAIVQSGATLVAGDDVALRVVVGPGAVLEVVEISATIAHPGPAEVPIRQRLYIELAEGAVLVLAEQPLVICGGAYLDRLTRIELANGARCLHREAVVLGREPEAELAAGAGVGCGADGVGIGPGSARVRLRVERTGRALLDDTLITGDPGVLGSAAVLGGARCLASAGRWGIGGDEPLAPGVLQIGPLDRLLRSPGRDAPAALGPVDATWSAWRAGVVQPQLAGSPHHSITQA